MKLLWAPLLVLLLTGCTLNIGHRETFVYERYPIYPEAKINGLENISGAEMMPYKIVVDKIRDSSDPEIKELIAEADKKADVGKKKIKGNIEKLLKWGQKNEATVKSYNKYARDKNERVEVYNKVKQ